MRRMEDKNSIFIRCDDGAETLVVDKIDILNYCYFSISIQDSYIYNANTFIGRVKRAFKVLFGKPIEYTSIVVSSKEDMRKFLDDFYKLVGDN